MLATLFLFAVTAQTPAGISRTQLVDNATVMCARLSYSAGAAETPHTHPFAAIVIQLTAGEVDLTIGDEHTRAHREAGFAWYIPREMPHALVNAGPNQFEQITIAIKPDRSPAAAGPATAAPPGITRTTLLDNADARVVRVEFQPAAREPVHEHPSDLVTVQLTAGRLEMTVGSDTQTERLAPGEVKFLPRNVAHSYASVDQAAFTLMSVTIK